MNLITRRSAVVGAVLAPFVVTGLRASPLTRVRFTLDWKYQGVHAWFYVARGKDISAMRGWTW
jgi:NitT/TauT family transport system substrate-binding protein